MNAGNTLTGMRAAVAKILSSNNVTGTITSLNRIGSVTEAGITCTNLTLNYMNGDYVSNITLFSTS